MRLPLFQCWLHRCWFWRWCCCAWCGGSRGGYGNPLRWLGGCSHKNGNPGVEALPRAALLADWYNIPLLLNGRVREPGVVRALVPWLLDRLEVPGRKRRPPRHVRGLWAAGVVDLHILVCSWAGIPKKFRADGHRTRVESVTPVNMR